MTPRSETEASAGDKELVITRVFGASRHMVFRMWTEAEHMRRWLVPRKFEMVTPEAGMNASNCRRPVLPICPAQAPPDETLDGPIPARRRTGRVRRRVGGAAFPRPRSGNAF